MTELYTILDQNEIDGSSKDVEIVTHGHPDDETTWTDVLTHTQFVPAGEYQFLLDWMSQLPTAKADGLVPGATDNVLPASETFGRLTAALLEIFLAAL